ncbi:hypothetical protein [Rhodoferax aquaticus]|uniref:Uncharacterized protein n=1 Tax=Rhodoferax aquaticus TaxID=2527691 RepID=A0A515ETR8_9BURK|nr:hypothetical protein [Rhodoferax aquaticus]QDL56070.1 hypothetical protein EXZ61_18960 [Rhodoferax aquaticus]
MQQGLVTIQRNRVPGRVEALALFQSAPISALGVYNRTLGNSGLLDEPSYTQFCIHHCVCQSRAYCVNFKHYSGHADASMARFAQPLRALLAQIHCELGIPVPLPA